MLICRETKCTRSELLEVWFALTNVNYHENIKVSIPLNHCLALTMRWATGPWTIGNKQFPDVIRPFQVAWPSYLPFGLCASLLAAPEAFQLSWFIPSVLRSFFPCVEIFTSRAFRYFGLRHVAFSSPPVHHLGFQRLYSGLVVLRYSASACGRYLSLEMRTRGLLYSWSVT